VADVGNSVIKWAIVRDGLIQTVIRLDLTDQQNWLRHYQELKLLTDGSPLSWAVAGSNTDIRDAHVHFLSRLCEERVHVFSDYRQVPIRVSVSFPERVGLDRLFNAVAVNSRRSANHSAIIIDIGSAVTVDLVDSSGAFQGGAIFPG